jgi:hypothetical protein
VVDVVVVDLVEVVPLVAVVEEEQINLKRRWMRRKKMSPNKNVGVEEEEVQQGELNRWRKKMSLLKRTFSLNLQNAVAENELNLY